MRYSKKRSYKNNIKRSKKNSYKKRSTKKNSYKNKKLENSKARILKFSVPKNSHKKYCAHLSNGRKVCFGERSMQQYKDSVPRSLGGGKYSSKNHLDKARRDRYRARHGGIPGKPHLIKNTPAYLSWKYLW